MLKDILKNQPICIPRGVYNEIGIREVKEIATPDKKELNGKWILVIEVQANVGKFMSKHNLDRGESEVILAAKENNATAVIDDLDARKVAKILGIKLTGTLALLKHAHTKSLINSTELKKIIEDLKMKDNFRIGKELESWVFD
ncbi:MAG: hypothetical protein QME59_01610 [Candidatus Hydrothermarchaeota archaeon]|nr:hypothetical protein [Candidatus Hydrothermarchaeota archaeon]